MDNMIETQDWRETLPQEWTVQITGNDGKPVEIPLAQHPILGQYANKDEAVKALVHAQRMIGRQPEGYMPVPDTDDEDARRAILSVMGMPAEPREYQLPEVELPEGVDLDENLLWEFLEQAHALGLTQEQTSGLAAWFIPQVIDMIIKLEGEIEGEKLREMESLRTVHRSETPRIMEHARQAVMALGGEELLAALDQTRAGNRAAVVSAFARMAPMLLEGSFKGRNTDPAYGLTKDKLRQMMRDPRYHDPAQRDRSYVKEIEEGFKALYPGEYSN